MTIRPPQSGQTPRQAIARVKSDAAPATPRRPVDPETSTASAPQRDAVQISSQARALQQVEGSIREDAGALAPERMREILSRMGNGHYDRPEVQDAVINRIAEEL